MSTLKNLLHLSVSVDGSQLRVATLNSTQYFVAPVISKVGNRVEWPINSEYPVLIPSSVLALATTSRNNRPVVMGHPQDELGNYISANDPEILARYCYGHMFNAAFDDDRVKCEIWLDPIRAEQVGPDAVRVIERLQAGETVEVSEGDYVLSDIEEGEFEGKKYGAVWVACWSDHLATLPENQKGACSIEDGCGSGILVSSQQSKMVYIVSALGQARKPTYTGTETSAWSKPTFADYIKYLFNGDEAPTSISKCSSDLLRRIASHSLLGDPSATNFQDLTFYPVVNPSTGYLNESALRGVIAGRGSSGLSDSALTSAQEMATRLLNSEFSANLPPKEPKPTAELEASVDKKKENLFKRMISSMSEALRNSMSNNDLRWKLYKAIEKIDPAISFVQDEDVATGIVLYTTIIRMGDYYSEESEYHNWQRSFTVDENENVTVGDDAVEIEWFQGWKPLGEATPKLETTVSAASVTGVTSESCGCHKGKGDESMSVNRVSAINRLSASGGPFAGNKAALEAMNDKGLEELEKAYPTETTNPNLPATPANPNSPVEPATETPAQPTPTPVNTPPATEPTQTVSLSREEYAKMLAASNAFEAQQQAKKAALVTSLSAAQSEFTAADLQAMEMSTLEKMGKAFKVDQPPTQASYVALPVNSGGNRPALRELPDPLGLKVHNMRPDGKAIEKAN